mmetsp:Transcript_20165/g.35854  ORF Transcript_20165/g.35854 Transcript_20165/m.35854 type:complete len:85 (-) Transcript_20165:263-517(-)|eukprot:CAMPEP_0184544174 /NCGR_PEP_ID=MMETSP0199_2-20130426/3441_1 /TAXON_ID=1112570 /ORGANISM="Thraustochytrium sp., Strain LLF1b" /LENGTH=84 /DNA_ID=CAMNT_0026938311 /DNA_START=163 /DNA_END=417 /DNA_ORIENTATION=-
MVEVTHGSVLTCTDVATQQLVQYLDSEKLIDNEGFIYVVLDDTHVFVQSEKVKKILAAIDAFSDQNAYHNETAEEAKANPKRKR